MSYGLVILSGGIDSTVCLHLATRSFASVMALTFDYGSRHNKREIECAGRTCKILGIQQTIIKMDFIREHFKSSLVEGGGGAIPRVDYSPDSIKSTVVPFRNGIMLSIAAGFAESKGYEAIVIGNHGGDHALYPDCTAEFLHGMRVAVMHGTHGEIKILSPFCQKDKTCIVKVGARNGVDFGNTYSCYQGEERHCGVCSTCRERKNAFVKARVTDPTDYKE